MQHIHFIGIAGAGLSALAQVMLGRGYMVSGSDAAAPNTTTEGLEKLGARIYAGHRAQNVAGADLVVVTSAARDDNPEVTAAHLQQIPIRKRRDFLREITRGNDVIAVAGSHGKTTTSAMIGMILEAAGADPTAVIGGTVPVWNTNARIGKSNWFVIEADEYDNAFLGLEPKIAVVTNVDYDHPDLFPTREEYQNAFANFLSQARTDGVIIVSGDEAIADRLASYSGGRVIRYGLSERNDWRALDLEPNELGGTDFRVEFKAHFVASLSLQIPGQHNVLNALAALVATQVVGADTGVAVKTLGQFGGVGRRFQVRGMFHGATIVDDYAHHPTEIRTSLRAARIRFPNARIWALFQPHTFSRTRVLLDEFAQAFADADRVLITEIFAARERNDTGLSSRDLVELMAQSQVRYVETLEEAERLLREELQAGDVLMTLGAGNVNQVAKRLVENGNA